MALLLDGQIALLAILWVPLGAAAVLALLPGYRVTARLNVLASLITLLAAFSLFFTARPDSGPYLIVDDVDRWHALMTAAGIAVTGVQNYDYGMREFSFTDPDGNNVRIGSPL